LSAYSAGLLASTTTRVYQSALFALRDTATPARAATVRVLVALVVGAVLMVQFEPVVVLGFTIRAGAFAAYDAAGVPLGPLGLAAGAALGAWIEWWWLRRRLEHALGSVRSGGLVVGRMLIAAVVAAVVARLLGGTIELEPLPLALVVAAVFGAVYWAAATALRLREANAALDAVSRRWRRR
jgi:putative peptidoglycan lipid II flippase